MLAGMMHDIGKLVFAACMPDEYGSIFTEAGMRSSTLCQREQELLGADHSRMGGYLLGIWGFADDIIEAVAFHHDPSNGFKAEANPFGVLEEQSVIHILTAVHVADALSQEPADVAEALDKGYLERLNLMDSVAKWRQKQEFAGAAF